jgi:hypothetical protein
LPLGFSIRCQQLILPVRIRVNMGVLVGTDIRVKGPGSLGACRGWNKVVTASI